MPITAAAISSISVSPPAAAAASQSGWPNRQRASTASTITTATANMAVPTRAPNAGFMSFQCLRSSAATALVTASMTGLRASVSSTNRSHSWAPSMMP